VIDRLALTVIARFSDAVGVASWSPDGEHLYVGTRAGDSVVMNLASQERRLGDHPFGVSTAQWSRRGAVLAVGGDDGVVVLWGPRQVEGDVCRLQHRAGITALAWRDDDVLAVAAGRDITLYDHRGQWLGEFPFRPSTVNALCWAPAHGVASLAAGTIGGIEWFSAGGPTAEPAAVDRDPGAVLTLELAPDGSALAAGDLSGEVRIAEFASDEVIELCGYSDRVCCLAWSAGSDLLAVPSGDEITVWVVNQSGFEPRPLLLRPEGDDVVLTAFSALGDRLAAADAAGRVGLWTPPAATMVAEAHLGAEVTAMAWHPAGTHLTVGTLDGHLRIAKT